MKLRARVKAIEKAVSPLASRDSTTARKIVYLCSTDDEPFSASMQHCTNNSVSEVSTVS